VLSGFLLDYGGTVTDEALTDGVQRISAVLPPRAPQAAPRCTCGDPEYAHQEHDAKCPLAEPSFRAPQGWQPIETAPKDGTKILALEGGWQYAVLAWWGRWDDGSGDMVQDYDPTLWIPIPPVPPSPGGEER
jgi:hypothetical protein